MSRPAPMSRTSAMATSAAEALTVSAAGGAAPAVLEDIIEVDARGLKRRGEAEADAGEHGDGAGEEEGRAVEGNLGRARQVFRGQGEESAHAPLRDQDAQRSAGDTEHDALGQELPDEPAAVCAESGADGKVLHPRRGTHEEEIGDVGAGDQKKEADGREQRPEDRAHVADGGVEQRRELHAPAGVGVGKLPGQTGGDRRELGPGLA
jgi:hypothetical protein